MRMNLFLEKSKVLMRIWVGSYFVWLLLLNTQLFMGYSNSGYSSLFERKVDGFELFLSFLFLVVFVSCWSMEIWKCNTLLQEYKGFIKGLRKTRSMKQLLFQLKMSILLIMISCFFCIMAGMMERLNWISVLLMLCAKFYYARKYKILINWLDPSFRDYVEEARKYR